MTESDIQTAIRIRASELGITLFRNNTGKVQGKDGRWHVFGLCVGSSDLIGYRTIKITQEHLGMEIAQFTAVEIKTKTGRVRPDQERFLDTVRASGGFSLIARQPEDLT